MDEFCYECGALGDDYYVDDNGEVVCACDDCVINMIDSSDD